MTFNRDTQLLTPAKNGQVQEGGPGDEGHKTDRLYFWVCVRKWEGEGQHQHESCLNDRAVVLSDDCVMSRCALQVAARREWLDVTSGASGAGGERPALHCSHFLTCQLTPQTHIIMFLRYTATAQAQSSI